MYCTSAPHNSPVYGAMASITREQGKSSPVSESECVCTAQANELFTEWHLYRITKEFECRVAHLYFAGSPVLCSSVSLVVLWLLSVPSVSASACLMLGQCSVSCSLPKSVPSRLFRLILF